MSKVQTIGIFQELDNWNDGDTALATFKEDIIPGNDNLLEGITD